MIRSSVAGRRGTRGMCRSPWTVGGGTRGERGSGERVQRRLGGKPRGPELFSLGLPPRASPAPPRPYRSARIFDDRRIGRYRRRIGVRARPGRPPMFPVCPQGRKPSNQHPSDLRFSWPPSNARGTASSMRLPNRVPRLSRTLILRKYLGFWGFGVLGFWGFGVLGFWPSAPQTPRQLPPHRYSLSQEGLRACIIPPSTQCRPTSRGISVAPARSP